MIIGITGSFGTGKSYVASIFKDLGAKVIDADSLARKALRKGSLSYEKIVEVFGKGILDKNGDIDRRALGRIVFNNNRKIKTLNRMIHPEVIKKIRNDIKKAARQDIVIIDAPLLIEAGLAGDVDKLLVVTASKETQIERCMKKFKFLKKEEVLRRIKNQIPLEEKIKSADFVIDNSLTKSRTKKEVIAIWRKMGYGDS